MKNATCNCIIHQILGGLSASLQQQIGLRLPEDVLHTAIQEGLGQLDQPVGQAMLDAWLVLNPEARAKLDQVNQSTAQAISEQAIQRASRPVHHVDIGDMPQGEASAAIKDVAEKLIGRDLGEQEVLEAVRAEPEIQKLAEQLGAEVQLHRGALPEELQGLITRLEASGGKVTVMRIVPEGESQESAFDRESIRQSGLDLVREGQQELGMAEVKTIDQLQRALGEMGLELLVARLTGQPLSIDDKKLFEARSAAHVAAHLMENAKEFAEGKITSHHISVLNAIMDKASKMDSEIWGQVIAVYQLSLHRMNESKSQGANASA